MIMITARVPLSIHTSPGALSYAALTIVDAMTQLKCPISTVAFGMCGSVASLILVREEYRRRPHDR